MVRVPPSGTWERRRADLYGLAEEWAGPPKADPARLVRFYLQGFGPATRHEIASFTGLTVSEIDVSGLDLRRFQAEDGAELLDLPRIFNTKLPQSLPTFLVDGTVAGTWRLQDGRIVLDPWYEIEDRDALEEEGRALAQYLGDQ